MNAKIWLGPFPGDGAIEKSLFDAVPIAQVVVLSIVIGPVYPISLIVRFVIESVCAMNGDELATNVPADGEGDGDGDGDGDGVGVGPPGLIVNVATPWRSSTKAMVQLTLVGLLMLNRASGPRSATCGEFPNSCAVTSTSPGEHVESDGE